MLLIPHELQQQQTHKPSAHMDKSHGAWTYEEEPKGFKHLVTEMEMNFFVPGEWQTNYSKVSQLKLLKATICYLDSNSRPT